MKRVYNFSAGPATLPQDVLQQAQQELLDWQGRGMSVMEMSHRSKDFIAIAEEAEADLRAVMGIPDNYKVLFLQSSGRGQFAMVPLNLLRGKKTADYLNTGVWSKMAIKEAQRYCDVNVAACSEDTKYTTIIPRDKWQLNNQAAYFHYVDNETVNGVEMPAIPDVGEVPLVADMSSNILSRTVDVSKFGLIYAGAQKNIGPAGLTIVIVRQDLVGNALSFTPTILDYKAHIDSKSMLYTPPTFAWYLAGLVFKWVKKQGGVEALDARNREKANRLYQFIDNSDFYNNPIDLAYRSRMNVVFTLADDSLNDKFLAQSVDAGLTQLKGHRLVGGMRASIYNPMSREGIEALVEFMQEFERNA